MRDSVFGARVPFGEAIKAKRQLPALLTLESEAPNRRNFAARALNLVQDVLRIADAPNQCEHVRQLSEIDRLIAPQAGELELVQADHSGALLKAFLHTARQHRPSVGGRFADKREYLRQYFGQRLEAKPIDASVVIGGDDELLRDEPLERLHIAQDEHQLLEFEQRNRN